MKITSFDWDYNNEEHVAEHGVTPEEAEEVFSKKTVIYKAKYGRYLALGQTEGGFFLTVIFEYLGKGKARVVTARPMSSKEAKLYRHKRRK
jgi:uncharacterized protein